LRYLAFDTGCSDYNRSAEAASAERPWEKGQAIVRATTADLANPCPMASFYLGTGYNEIPAEALRVLDAGLALPTPLPGSDIAESRPLLIGRTGGRRSQL
jgi:hypothetical protein